MNTIRDLSVNEANRVNMTILRNTTSLARELTPMIRYVRYVENPGNINILEMFYDGFLVTLCVVEGKTKRMWIPEKNYDKNYFCTYFFGGTIEEFTVADDKLINTQHGEFTITDSIALSFPTYETYVDSAWFCFSSWKPYTSVSLRIDGQAIIPANVGVYVVLGTITDGDITLKSLDFVPPTDHDWHVTGDAKVFLITPGKFLNVPT